MKIYTKLSKNAPGVIMMVELMDPKADETVCDIKTPRLIQFNYSYSLFAA